MTYSLQIFNSKPRKFCFINFVYVFLYQRYWNALKDLTLVEEAVIVYAYPIISILKLKPIENNPCASYQRVYGHIVLLS